MYYNIIWYKISIKFIDFFKNLIYNILMIKKCKDCPRMCLTERNSKVGFGYCKLPDKIYIAHYGIHNFEEPCISGKQGSGTIFFSGCNLKCEYCQNYEISRSVCGKGFSVSKFIDVIKSLENMNVENINMVSPTPYARHIIKAFKIYKPKIPVIYNTHGYERPEIIKKLMPYIDIFLTDFKYANNDYAKFSNCVDYEKFAKKSLKIMLEKPNIFENDMMKSGVIVRHLVLPGCLENTYKVLDILNEMKVEYVSIMSQFTPIYNKGYLNRKITTREYNLVLDKLYNYNFEGFVQDLESANKKYIPNFSLIK